MSDAIQVKIDNELKAVGEALKYKIDKEKLTNKAIQSNTGMAINTIKSVLAGEAGNIKSYAAIAKVFNISLFDLIDEAKKFLSHETVSTPPVSEPVAVAKPTTEPVVEPAKVEDAPSVI